MRAPTVTLLGMTTQPDEKQLLHIRAAAQWAFVLRILAQRLHDAQRAALSASRASRLARYYGPEDAQPFLLLKADRQFFISAAHHLVVAVDGSNGHLPTLDHPTVRLLRNAMEHWDEPQGWSACELADQGFPDPTAHSWGAGGTQLGGGALDVDALLPWAAQVYDAAKGL